MQNPYFVNPALFLQGFGDTINTAESIKKAKMYNKFAPKEEQAKLADLMARSQNDQAMSKYAPELYGSRAGLASLQMQEQPQLFNSQMANAASERQLRNLQGQYELSRLNGVGSISPKSSFGKLTSDYDNAVKQYGANSPQAQSIGSYMKKMEQSNSGITVGQDENGHPLVQIGIPSGGNGRTSGGQTVVDTATGQVYSTPTYSQKSKLQSQLQGDQQLHGYLLNLTKNYPRTSLWDTTKYYGEGGVNYVSPWVGKSLGLNFQSTAAEADTNTFKTAEQIMAANKWPSTDKAREDALTIAKRRWGENDAGYIDRVMRQSKEYSEQYRQVGKNIMQGYDVGTDNNGDINNNISNLSLDNLIKLKNSR